MSALDWQRILDSQVWPQWFVEAVKLRIAKLEGR